ncbi:MAG: hypothetical protein KAQ64_04235 [Candidatus Pacebacteria bacterium]|nr:hypothetical protein [Candidatus Paceibacterota bacterium]
MQPDEYFEDFRDKFQKNIRNEQKSINGVDKLLKQIYEEFKDKYGSDIINEDGCIIGASQKTKNEEKQEEYFKLLDLWKEDWESYEDFLKRKETINGTIWEKMTVIILNKILGEDFIIVHSSINDDTYHSIDTLIIDKKTGEIVCTLDEVETDLEKSIYYEKIRKLAKINEKFGGAFIEDGLELKDGKLINKNIRNIPIYLFQISEEDFEKVLAGMNIDSMEKVSDIELEIFDEMIKSLEKQNNELQKGKISENLQEKIEIFSKSLETMKEIRKKKFQIIKEE